MTASQVGLVAVGVTVVLQFAALIWGAARLVGSVRSLEQTVAGLTRAVERLASLETRVSVLEALRHERE